MKKLFPLIFIFIYSGVMAQSFTPEIALEQLNKVDSVIKNSLYLGSIDNLNQCDSSLQAIGQYYLTLKGSRVKNYNTVLERLGKLSTSTENYSSGLNYFLYLHEILNRNHQENDTIFFSKEKRLCYSRLNTKSKQTNFDIARSFSYSGDYSAVVNNYQKGFIDFEINKQKFNDSILGYCYFDYGYALKRIGQYQTADIYLKKAFSIMREKKNICNQNYINLLINIIEIHEHKEEYKEMDYYIKFFEECISPNQENHISYTKEHFMNFQYIGYYYSNIKSYEKALRIYKLAEPIGENIYKNERWYANNLLWLYNSIAYIYFQLNNTELEKHYYLKAIELGESEKNSWGGKPINLIYSHIGLANLLEKENNDKIKILANLNEALKIAKKEIWNTQEQFICLKRLIELHLKHNNKTQAIEYYNEILKINKNTGIKLSTAENYKELYPLTLAIHGVDSMLVIYDKVINIYRELYQKDSFIINRFVSTLAYPLSLNCDCLGNDAKTKKYTDIIKEISNLSQQIPKVNSRKVAESFIKTSEELSYLDNDYDLREVQLALFQKAVDYFSQNNSNHNFDKEIYDTYLEIASLYQYMGIYKKGIANYYAAANIYHKLLKFDRELENLNFVIRRQIVVYSKLGHIDSLKLLENVINNFPIKNKENLHLLEELKAALGQEYKELGEGNLALQLLKKVNLDSLREYGREEVLENLIDLYLSKGELTKAESYFKMIPDNFSLDNSKYKELFPQFFQSNSFFKVRYYYNRYLINHSVNDLKYANDINLKLIRSQGKASANPKIKNDYTNLNFDNNILSIKINYELLKYAEGISNLSILKLNIFQDIEFMKSVWLTRELNNKEAMSLAEKNTITALDNLIEKRNQLQLKISTQNIQGFDKITLKIKVDSIAQQIELLETKLEKENPNYKAEKNNTGVEDILGIKARLDSNQTMLSYTLLDSNLLIILLNKDNDRDTFLLLSPNDTKKILDDVKVNSGQENNDKHRLSDLYSGLIKPIEDKLKSRLIIIKDPAFFDMSPFESFATNDTEGYENKDFLLHKYAISYAYSATVWAKMYDKQHEKEPIRVYFGIAPTFAGSKTDFASSDIPDTDRNLELKVLKNTTKEVKKGQEIFGGKIYTGKDATKQRVLDSIAYFRFVVLASHSGSNKKHDEDAYIAFHNAETDQNERLYLDDIYSLQLNMDLLLLASCESNVGKTMGGENISLSRAFTYAGAKSIVSSQWNTNDGSTFVIDTTFFRYLKNGDTKDIALQKAKIDYLKTAQNKNPYFWAALTLNGDSKSLFHKNVQNYSLEGNWKAEVNEYHQDNGYLKSNIFLNINKNNKIDFKSIGEDNKLLNFDNGTFEYDIKKGILNEYMKRETKTIRSKITWINKDYFILNILDNGFTENNGIKRHYHRIP